MLPILLLFQGDSYYLEPIIRQIRFFNPENQILLFCDESTKRLPNCLKCDQVLIKDYSESVEEFDKLYQHMSTNSIQFERLCFERWFIFKDYCIKHLIQEFVHIDPDVVLFGGVDKFVESFRNYDFTYCGRYTPNFTYIKLSSLCAFCDFINDMYKDTAIHQEITDWYADYHASGLKGGVCDMTAFRKFDEKNMGRGVNISIPHDGHAMDDCYLNPSGYEANSKQRQLLTNKTPKKIYWKDNKPFALWEENGEFVELIGLHMQGSAKLKIIKFLVNTEGKLSKSWGEYLCWYLNPAVFCDIYHRLYRNVRRKILR